MKRAALYHANSITYELFISPKPQILGPVVLRRQLKIGQSPRLGKGGREGSRTHTEPRMASVVTKLGVRR
jgi:hypothetical protein